jgi:hypothetical protein
MGTKKRPLYRAWVARWAQQVNPVEGVDQIIYDRRPSGNLIGELPLGARPMPPGQCGSFDRTDGGDPFQKAIFTSASGRIYIIERSV